MRQYPNSPPARPARASATNSTDSQPAQPAQPAPPRARRPGVGRMRTGAAVARASTAAARRATRARSGRPDGAQGEFWLLRPVERRERERAALAAEHARQGARIDYVRKRARPDSRQADLWPVDAAHRRAAEAEAKRQIARWLNYQTMSGPASGRARPLAEIDADIDAVAARCVGRVKHLDAAAAYRAARSLYRRHRRRVESGAWARSFSSLQSMRARLQSGPRLDRCAARDRRIVRLRRAGHSWRAIGRRVGCSHVNCQGAPARLRKRAARRNRERLERRRAARAARRAAERARAACQGGNRAIRYRPRYSETSCQVWDSVGAAHLPRVRAKPGEGSTFGALRRAAYAVRCRFDPALPDDEIAELVRTAAARSGIAYDGASVAAATAAAGWLWKRGVTRGDPCLTAAGKARARGGWSRPSARLAYGGRESCPGGCGASRRSDCTCAPALGRNASPPTSAGVGAPALGPAAEDLRRAPDVLAAAAQAAHRAGRPDVGRALDRIGAQLRTLDPAQPAAVSADWHRRLRQRLGELGQPHLLRAIRTGAFVAGGGRGAP